MYQPNAHGWPWGTNRPTRLKRGLVAALIAFLVYNGYQLAPPHWHSDFSLSWFGAKSMLQGKSPYPLVGPGGPFRYQFPLVYPATAFVAAMPFALLPEYLASSAFVWIPRHSSCTG